MCLTRMLLAAVDTSPRGTTLRPNQAADKAKLISILASTSVSDCSQTHLGRNPPGIDVWVVSVREVWATWDPHQSRTNCHWTVTCAATAPGPQQALHRVEREGTFALFFLREGETSHFHIAHQSVSQHSHAQREHYQNKGLHRLQTIHQQIQQHHPNAGTAGQTCTAANSEVPLHREIPFLRTTSIRGGRPVDGQQKALQRRHERPSRGVMSSEFFLLVFSVCEQCLDKWTCCRPLS